MLRSTLLWYDLYAKTQYEFGGDHFNIGSINVRNWQLAIQMGMAGDYHSDLLQGTIIDHPPFDKP